MARLNVSIHLYREDVIRPGRGGQSKWLSLGEDFAIFASDEKLAELRDVIDAYLGREAVMAQAATEEAA